MNKQQIKKILEEEADLDKAVEQILALDNPKKSKVESTVITDNKLGYEILSFKDKYSNRIMTKTGQKEIVYSYNGWYLTEHHLLTNSNWVIHEIKRLSDGVRFKIGDTLKIKNSKTIWGKIDKFWVSHDQLRVDSGNLGGVLVHADGMECLELTKTPLFKTEDGVVIFDGDTYYWVPTNADIHVNFVIYEINNAKKSNEVFDKRNKVLNFSTKEAAENYVILNKPCLSVNEVIKKLALSENGLFANRLKHLLKSKL